MPLVGMGMFLVTFVYAASAYPGGSENIPRASSYSFFHNFLCDLMEPQLLVGGENTARPKGIFAHVILSLTMMSFFYFLPEIFDWRNAKTQIIRYMGMLSMAVLGLMFTPYHDFLVTGTAVIGSIALIPFFLEMRKYPDGALKTLAYLCFAMSVVVFFIFVTKIGYYYLPFLQKITFMLDASWVIWVALIVFQKRATTLINRNPRL